MNTSRVMIPALLAAALIGGTMTSDAFAGPHHRGQGNGYGPCYGYGDGGCWEGGWGHHGHARGWGYRAMSDAQRAKFDKIMEEFAPRMEQLRDSIYVKRQELRALENATNPDVKAVREAATEMARLRGLRNRLWDGVKDMEEVYLNGDLEQGAPNILNVSFNYVEGESLIMALKDLAVSSGSACTSASLEPSYVLRALGMTDELAHSSIRFSLGRFTTEEEIDYTIDLVRKSIGRLRDLSPLWDMFKQGVDLNSIEWSHH